MWLNSSSGRGRGFPRPLGRSGAFDRLRCQARASAIVPALMIFVGQNAIAGRIYVEVVILRVARAVPTEVVSLDRLLMGHADTSAFETNSSAHT